jgi:hypothetical protein
MNDDAQPSLSPDGSVGTDQRSRKKQKRNKPTLSCEECVERKTKVRARSRKLWMMSMSRRWTIRSTITSGEREAEDARSATAVDLIVWHASSDSRHAGFPTLRT